MVAINQRIPNFLGGVSQQPDTIKIPGQVRVMDNAVPDVTFGLMKRPPGEYVNKLTNANSSGYWYEIIRDGDEKYLVQITPGNTGNIPISLSTPDSVFICQGDTVIIEGPPGFVLYNWSTGATTSSIMTTSTGNYNLSVIDGNGCTGTSNTTTISKSPQTINATTSGNAICIGNSSVTLDAGAGFSSAIA